MATTTYLEPGTDATQDLVFFAAITNNASSATDQAYTGLRSIKLFTGSPALQAIVRTGAGVVADAGSQISFYIRRTRIPTANETTPLFIVATSGVLSIFTLSWGTAGTIWNRPQGATAVQGTAVLAINTWYRVSVSYYITDTTTYTCKVYVNGVLDSTTNAGTLTRTASSLVRFLGHDGIGANESVWIDNIYVATGGASSSSQPDTGNILVTAKRPNANGTTNGFTTQIGSGGSGYGSGHSPQVNEQPLSVTNGWSIIGSGSAVTEEYNIEGMATGDVDISAKTLVDYIGWLYSSALVAETGQIIVNNSASNIALTTTNTLFIKAAGSTTYPAGTGTDIGEITDTTLTTVSLFECGIIFAYLEPRRDLLLIGVGV